MRSRLLTDLLERRVPQYTAAYLGASWIAIEFLAFLEDRFLLSPHLTNLVLALLVLVLPSVILFTYFHGRPGADRWRRIEKVFIPANLVLAAVVLLAGFSGKELGAVTTTVDVVDAEGNAVHRVVPKSEFRRRLALFPPDAPADSGWLGDVLLLAVHMDLYQDLFLDVRSPPHYLERLRQRGLDDARGLPRPLKREVARELQLDHFVDGAVTPDGEGYRVEVSLHDTEHGDAVATRAFRGADLLSLADSVSRAIRQALDLPGAHLESSPDLPVAELTTASLPAFREMAEGSAAVTYAMDFAAARAHFERATELDPGFAAAYVGLYQVRYLDGDEGGAGEALRAAMDHLYRLPERMQLAVKAELYGYRQDMDRYLATLEMRTEIYPQDLDAHLAVAQVRRLRGDVPGVIEALGRALELDPTRGDLLLQIGDLQLERRDFEQAEEHFQRYIEQAPSQPEGHLALGRLHTTTGAREAAAGSFDRALLLDPDNTEALAGLARLARYEGRWPEAERRAGDALKVARSPMDRGRAYRELRAYAVTRKDFDRAVTLQERVVAVSREYLPPAVVAQIEIIGAEHFARAGRAGEVRARIDELAAELPESVASVVRPIGAAEVWTALGRPDSAEAELVRAEEALERTGYQAAAALVARTRGRAEELRGDWEQALRTYERQRELEPADPWIPARMGRAYRELGDTERAEALLLETLRVWPAHPEANYDLGLLYLEAGQPEDAVRHLERSVDAWSLANPEDAEAAAARARLAEARLQLRAVRQRG